ncbi:MAG: hypothetical protein FJY95_05175 [Candidatus Handelsmanbacteria bacterium]|nr:hypothetical protein [Candidatus Handelsmanbacteria bacterium]
MSEQVAPIIPSLSAQALSLVSREFRNRQETGARAADRRFAAKDPSQAELVQKERARLSERVDHLVQSKKAVASRISSEAVSPPQRTVLVSRANDLQRQVNELDGIVGGEGQGELSRAATLASRPQATAPAAVKPQAAPARRPQTTSAMVKPEIAANPGAQRSAPTQEQPNAGALRAFAKNAPAAPAPAVTAAVTGAALVTATRSEVDLIA